MSIFKIGDKLLCRKDFSYSAEFGYKNQLNLKYNQLKINTYYEIGYISVTMKLMKLNQIL